MDDPPSVPPFAHRPERVPLTAEQEKNFAATVEQANEEALAKRISMPTKLLGWMMIAGFGFDIASSMTNAGQSLGGFVFLFVGIGVLNGSQAALRFATFMLVLGSFFSLAGIAWAVARQQPIEIGRHWADWRDLKFWTLGVSPAVYLVAEAVLAVISLRLRQLVFGTKTVRVWAWIVAGMLLLKGAFTTRDYLRDRVVRRELATEVNATRDHFSATGGRTSTASIRSVNETFDRLPRVKSLVWSNSPNSQMIIYDRFSRAESRATIATGKSVVYSEWLKPLSGEWGKFELEVILPESP